MLKSLFVKNGQKRGTVEFFIENPLYLIIVALIVIIALFDVSFFNIASFNTILTQSATRLMFAVGIAGIIVMGGNRPFLGPSGRLGGCVCGFNAAGPKLYHESF